MTLRHLISQFPLTSTLALTGSLAMGVGCSRANDPQTERPPVVASAGAEATQPCGDARVLFETGSSSLDAPSSSRLDRFAECLNGHDIDAVYVSGMTDPEGTPEENLVLGRARARAVADYLLAHGVNVDFVIRSYGETGATATEPLWQSERRADVTAVSTASEG